MSHILQQTVISVNHATDITDEFSSTRNQVTSFKDRLQWTVDLSKLSNRALSLKAGLAHVYVSDLLREQDPNPSIDGLRKLARAADVSLGWLVTGQGSPVPFLPDAAGPLPPLSSVAAPLAESPQLVVHENERSLVDAAFRPGKHTFLAGLVIFEHLRSHALELPIDVPPVPWVRRWLDVATDLQRRKEPITARLVMNEVMRRALEQEEAVAQRSSELTAEATRGLEEAHGIKPPTTLHPLLQEAREREAVEDREEAADLARKARDKQLAGKSPAHDMTPKPPSSASRKKR